MDALMKPIYLLADSQLLFWKDNGKLFLQPLRDMLDEELEADEEPLAVYIGASNGDQPEFYEIFRMAMESIGITNCRMIHSDMPEEEEDAVEDADLILLSGGDVERGWRVFEKNDLQEIIVRRYYEGALLMGTSAGAVQLGMMGWTSGNGSAPKVIDTFRLIPLIIDVHQEKADWQGLQKALRKSGGAASAIGIPSGGGMAYHTDHTIEAIRYPLHEYFLKEGKVTYSLLHPPGPDAPLTRKPIALPASSEE